MDFRKELLSEYSKANTLRIANYIGSDKTKFSHLMKLFFGDDYKLSQYASWIVSHCFDAHPHLVDSYLERMVLNLENKNVHDAVKRNTVRIFQFATIPEELLGRVINICFGFLQSNSEPIAVKVYSMTVLANISSRIPEIVNELKWEVEKQYPYSSPGFKSRARKILKKLSK
ncbi:MAG: hypothetical protein J0M08_03645 [Bacteroidetes bacterium]|nr:hypothetical protein [Bacteroidota bacterium]